MNIKRMTQKFVLFKKSVFFRVVVVGIIVLFGFIGMFCLASMKQSPEEVDFEEQCLKVETLSVEAGDYPINIVGHGVIRPVILMDLASEIKGKVVFVNPNLRPGGVILSGEVLFELDDLNHVATLREAQAYVDQCKSIIKRLNKQQAVDISRVCTLKKNRDLAMSEFERVKKLFEEHRVGSKSDVDRAEIVYNSAFDCVAQILKTVSLYPMQIYEANCQLESAESQLMRVKANLEKCSTVALFCARVKSSSIEVGEVILPGQKVAVLADDSCLEIEVFLDSDDVERWIQFDDSNTINGTTWFSKVKPVLCEIVWVGNSSKFKVNGYLDRVVKFDKRTHTVTVIVKIENSNITKVKEIFPIVDGMFCTVKIPGIEMKQVYRLPRQAVNFENKVCLVDKNSRLKIVPVVLVRTDGEYAFVDGLNSSDIVVTTRILNPLEGSLLSIDGDTTEGTLD